jgi:hypothetical protein
VKVGIVVLVEVGIGRAAVEVGRVMLPVGVDCTGEAQDANRHITRRKTLKAFNKRSAVG